MPIVRKAVITAAGRGTRQYPATNTLQKELITLVDRDGYTKPTLQLILEDALAGGIEELCVVANPDNAEPIRRHFHGLTAAEREGAFRGKDWAFPLSDSLQDIGERLTIAIQHEPSGYGDAVYQAREWVGNEPFLLMVGDHITITPDGADNCPRQIARVYEKNECPVSSVARVPSTKVSRYGTCAGELVWGSDPLTYTMKAMQEKPSVAEAAERLVTPGLPADTYLCFYGLHVFPAEVFHCLHHLIDNNIRERGEIQMAAAQEMLFQRGRYVVSELSGEQHDMGTPDGLIHTQLALALHSPYRDAVRRQAAEYR